MADVPRSAYDAAAAADDAMHHDRRAGGGVVVVAVAGGGGGEARGVAAVFSRRDRDRCRTVSYSTHPSVMSSSGETVKNTGCIIPT